MSVEQTFIPVFTLQVVLSVISLHLHLQHLPKNKMELTTMMMFLRLNSSGNISTIDVDNNHSNDLNASRLDADESASNAVQQKLLFNECFTSCMFAVFLFSSYLKRTETLCRFT